VVFDEFAGFNALLGQDWFRHHKCMMEIGTDRVIINTCNRNFVLSSIVTKNKAATKGPVFQAVQMDGNL
jgi:hypothetical protein